MLMFLNFFLFFTLFIYYLVSDLLVWWLMLEVFFYAILVILFYYVNDIKNLMGVILYFFVQGVVSVLLIMFLVFFLGVNGIGLSFLKYALFLVFLFKMGFFPFYYQVVFIFTKLNNNQCFVMGFYPKVLPLIWVFMLNMYYLSFMVFFYLMFTFLITAYFGLKSLDVRELMGWSSVNFGGWVLMSVLCNNFLFVLMMMQYCISTYIFFFVLGFMSGNFFINNYEGVSKNFSVFVFVSLLFMTGIAPIGLFVFKLFLLMGFLEFFSLGLLVLILFCLVGSFFFYLRMLQMVMHMGASYSLFNTNFNGVCNFNFFLFLGLNVFLIVLILSV
nr:NADH dehydrogenase subunit 2 [Microcosmus sp. z YZ-2024]